jgi:hypothetical protein
MILPNNKIVLFVAPPFLVNTSDIQRFLLFQVRNYFIADERTWKLLDPNILLENRWDVVTYSSKIYIIPHRLISILLLKLVVI